MLIWFILVLKFIAIILFDNVLNHGMGCFVSTYSVSGVSNTYSIVELNIGEG